VNIFAGNGPVANDGTATAVLLGARNSLAFNVYYSKGHAISGTGAALPPQLQFGQDNTQ
jgi:hypothetical protein